MPGKAERRLERLIAGLIYVLAALSVAYSLSMVAWFLLGRAG